MEGRHSRSPGGRRNKSPDREGIAERRAKIEQWNKEKEQAETGNKKDNGKVNNNSNSDGGAQDEEDYSDPQQQTVHLENMAYCTFSTLQVEYSLYIRSSQEQMEEYSVPKKKKKKKKEKKKKGKKDEREEGDDLLKK
ncbi:hypothetical protein RJ639_036170 [Escallonia herrerae]|uniref:Uncharacterized protein n=1 Tax=Escallonia herrerae TaxID=1293975 RepID=A0AA88WRN1_9ASTE|nr:hypothetical protein RJ639_036170 [Escallonia herrerae]